MNMSRAAIRRAARDCVYRRTNERVKQFDTGRITTEGKPLILQYRTATLVRVPPKAPSKRDIQRGQS